MKKYNIFVNLICNVVIISVIVGLYLACVPKDTSVSTLNPIYKGNTESDAVAIMVNVYQGEQYAEQIIDILNQYDAVCTFFVGGSWVARHPDTLKKMYEAGDEIGNHGYLHRDHASLNEKQNRDEISLCHKLVKETIGFEMTLFAPPSGSYAAATNKVCEELNYKVIMWSKDTIDWRDKDSDVITKRATNNVAGGDMILMHPTEATVKALPGILKSYKEKGLRTVKVSEIISAGAMII